MQRAFRGPNPFPALRAAHEAARGVVREVGGRHDHDPNRGCLVCLASVDSETAAMAAAAGQYPQGWELLVTFGCRNCLDSRWVEWPVGTDRFAPCPDCSQATFERWDGGNYDPRHDQGSCDQCKDLQRGGR